MPLHRSVFIVTIALLTFTLAACQSASRRNVQMSYDERVDFASYESFHVEFVRQQHQILGLTSLIDSAIQQELMAKGLTPAAQESADLLVRYTTAVERTQGPRLEQIPTGDGVITRPLMEPINEGSILVNILDRASGDIIWKASSVSDITGVDIEELSQAQVDEAITELFEDYPSSSMFDGLLPLVN
ncbi:DUF4136 domain-containing protein [Allohahella marinimesophila]|uniref:DUF4136 domain-containing protein n=1 Tax=Allohahella marinimesophila TaxID=1054972 RepID=A0ABP7P296_9GAMM